MDGSRETLDVVSMKSDSLKRAANPPPKPLLLFDGDCHFCRGWVERWRGITGSAVDYATSQEAGTRFPEISPAEFERAVQLVEADGTISSGARAVFRSLGYGQHRGWLPWSYEHVPGFAGVTELAYSIVARNRQLASAGTRLFWGDDVSRPTYQITRSIFLRALGLIFLIAFVSLWTQIDGLVGSGGIAPVADYLAAAKEQLGGSAPFVLPTLCWLNSTNAFLHLMCGVGAAFSALLILGLAPALCSFLLFVCYLSLTIAGQTFLSFQWDILLLETGFLAIFFAPWRWKLSGKQDERVSGVGLFLLKLLLFKLMLMSGVVKLTSGDDSWWNLTALNFHYETQPLPTVLGWWAHQAPDWFRSVSTAFVLVVETLVPFLIWAPRRLRLVGCALLILLQVLIALTGNYAFFNLLTIVLCLLLIDDVVWQRLVETGVVQPAGSEVKREGFRISRICAGAVLIVTLPLNCWLLWSAFEPETNPPRVITAVEEFVEPFRIANGYGLFRVMTKTRPEIVIEGSADGVDWKPYAFRWKPGALKTAPRWVAPHQPRLDWQMWFAALGSYRQNRWFVQLAARLLENAPDVAALFETNPFPQTPPRYIRAQLFDYRFTTMAERRASGAWWKAEEQGEYLPTVSLPEH